MDLELRLKYDLSLEINFPFTKFIASKRRRECAQARIITTTLDDMTPASGVLALRKARKLLRSTHGRTWSFLGD